MAHFLVARSRQKRHAKTRLARIGEPNVSGTPGMTWSWPWRVVIRASPLESAKSWGAGGRVRR